MSPIENIKEAVRMLSEDELADFRAWFAEFDAQAWDRQFEQDVAAVRLDRLAEEALQDMSETMTSHSDDLTSGFAGIP